MDNFGSRLRSQLSDERGKQQSSAVADIVQWIEDEVHAKLESSLEQSVAAGKDKVVFQHPFLGGLRIHTADIEALPAYVLLKSQCDRLGLECIAMSHARLLNYDPTVYPCLEILVRLPPAWKLEHPE